MVKFYDFARAPNPRRARMFLSEKGIDNIDIIQVDLGNKEQLGEEFRKINPLCTVPALVLDDGTLITESVAICRYFEELQPSPSMMGRDATAPLPAGRSRPNRPCLGALRSPAIQHPTCMDS